MNENNNIILSFNEFVDKCRMLDEACRQWCEFIDEAPERRDGLRFTEFFSEICKQKYDEYLTDPSYRDDCNYFAAENEGRGVNKETNAGYKITEKLTVGNFVFVLGSNDTRYGTKYVTWQARADDPANYFWGHYLENYEDAREDLFERAHSESQSLNPNYHRRQMEKLPDFCMSTRPSDGCLIIIKHKESGYKVADISTEDAAENKYHANYINDLMDVAPAQEAAMVAGSMFGWNVPAANPVNYDDKGNAIKPKSKPDRDSRLRRMNNRIIRTQDGRVYYCAGCPYRNREAGFCGFCMQKILDEMKDKKNGKEESRNGV